MNIGDKVRVLRGREEGIITRIIDNKLIEIEIEDGFQIPVLRSEVVVVAKEESSFFKPDAGTQPAEKTSRNASSASEKQAVANEGVYLAFRPLNDRILAVYLINNSSQQLPFTVYEESRKNLKGLSCGTLNERAYSKLGEVSLQNFDEWPSYIFQFLFFSSGSNKEVKMPQTKKINFKAASFYRNRRVAPLLSSEAYTFRLDGETKAIDAEQLKERLNESGGQEAGIPAAAPPTVLDLHIEKLSPHAAGLSSQEILNLQLSTFEKHLDQAIASGLDEVVYIHGVGNGTLRSALHKHLGKMNNISFFQDAQKNRFGFGATMVRIK